MRSIRAVGLELQMYLYYIERCWDRLYKTGSKSVWSTFGKRPVESVWATTLRLHEQCTNKECQHHSICSTLRDVEMAQPNLRQRSKLAGFTTFGKLPVESGSRASVYNKECQCYIPCFRSFRSTVSTFDSFKYCLRGKTVFVNFW